MGKDSLARRERTRPYERQRRSYAKNAPEYDREADLIERWIFGTKHRGWACSQAVGETLEVAIGTGLNLTHYPADVRLIGIDLSPEMLAFAEARARNIGCPVGLIDGAAQVLPFADCSFDTVVCTYALCSVPDDAEAIGEMKRVLKAGGRLILVDHVRSTVKPIFWFQRLYEFIPSRAKGEYLTRRPAIHVNAAGFDKPGA